MAIVGTRASDPDAENFAYSLAARLDRAGFVVLSGGARGIDTAAHMGSLSETGKTVAVLATGLEHPYPSDNHNLFAAIRRRGALVTEISGSVPPHPGRFLRRNQLVAAVARMLVVVQAPARSGALSTARCAMRLGKPVLALPAAPWDVRGAGVLGLLASGAGLCTKIDDVLAHPALADIYVPGGTQAEASCRPDLPLSDDAQTVLAFLEARTSDADELKDALALTLPRVYASLQALVGAGLVQRRGLGKFGRRLQRADISAIERRK